MKLSKSKVNSFLKCRREFKYNYIDGIEMPPNEYMAFGTVMHEYAEKMAKFLKNKQDKGIVIEETDIENAELSILDTHRMIEEGVDDMRILKYLDNLKAFFYL